MLLFVCTLSINAATYEYLVFKTSDGTQTTMTANGLRLVFKDGQLTATNGTVSQTFDFSSMDRMFFSHTKEGNDVTAISEATADDLNDADTEIYDLSGRRMPQGITPKRGLYIFKKGNTTTKKYVK
jgi:hypothetical protein